MQPSGKLYLSLLVVLVAASVQLLGCATARLAPEDVTQAFIDGEERFGAGDYAAAMELLQTIQDRQDVLSEEQIQKTSQMLRQCEEQLAAQKDADHLEKERKATAILQEARKLSDEGRYDLATQRLSEMEDIEDFLKPQQVVELEHIRCAREEKARELIEQGLAAYHDGDYLGAEDALKKARELEAELGFWDGRKLTGTLATVEQKLALLNRDYDEAEAAFQSKKYERARGLLAGIQAEGIETGKDVDGLLAKVEEAVADRDKVWREKADALLASAADLAGKGDFDAAEAKLAELEGLSEYLSEEQAAQVTELGGARARQAGVHYEAGMAHYEAKNYPKAQSELAKASALAADLGRTRNRELRRALSAVNETLGELTESYAEAEAAFEAEEYERARELLEDIQAEGIETGKDVDGLLAKVEEAVADRDKVWREKADALLASADQLVQKADFDAAEARLAEVRELADYLTPEQRARLRELSGAFLRTAQDHYEAGMWAYKTKNYLKAQSELHKAAALEAGLGGGARRRLYRALSEVEDALAELSQAYEEAEQAYQAKSYEQARGLLLDMLVGGIKAGKDVDGLLAKVEKAMADRDKVWREKADVLLTSADQLVQKGDFEAAEKKLVELNDLVDCLTPEQRAKLSELAGACVSTAEGHYEAGMAAYEAKDYLKAQSELEKVVALEADLGSSRNRALRRTLAAVKEKLGELAASYGEAEAAFAGKEYERAREILEGIQAEGIETGKDVDGLLAKVAKAVSDRDKAWREKADALLASADQLVQKGDFEAAEAKLAEVRELADYLTAQQRAKLSELAGACVRTAEGHYEAGMAAYEAKDYLKAQSELEKVVALEADLGWRRNRALRGTLAAVKEKLGELAASWGEAEAAFAGKEYERAREILEDIQAEGIETGKDVAGLLAKVEKAVADRDKVWREKADALLASADQFVQNGNFEAAEAKLAEVRELDDHFTAEQRAKLSDLSGACVRTAEGRYEAGMAAYEAKDYLKAQSELEKVVALEADLGWRRNRALRGTLAAVKEKLGELAASYGEAEAAFAGKEYERAREILEDIQAEGIRTGKDVDGLLAKVAKAISDREGARRAKAAELLASAGELVQKGDFDAAEAKLAELKGLVDYLTPEQRAKLSELSGACVSTAEGHYEAGMAAYEAKDYPKAQSELEKAVALEADLGWRSNRALRRTLAAVAKKLGELAASYEEAEAAFAGKEYERARELLEDIQAEGIRTGKDVDGLLAKVLKAIADRENAFQAKADELLTSAAELAQKGDVDAAEAKLAEVRELDEHLTAEQRAKLSDLSDVRVRTAQGRYEAGMAAYEAKNYLKAQAELGKASALDAELGFWDGRKLSGTLATVQKKLAALERDYTQAQDAFEAGDYERAGELLEDIQAEGIETGKDVDGLLAKVLKAIADRENAFQAKADELLTSAAELAEKGDVDAAEAKLVQVRELDDHLTAEQRAKLSDLSDVRVRTAQGHYEAGMAAYEAKDYPKAQSELTKASALDADLGWGSRRRLSSVLSKVEETLAELNQAYEDAEAALGAKSYEQARELLLDIQAEGIQIGKDVDGLLAKVEKAMADREEAMRKKADGLLSSAAELAEKGDFGSAEAKLAEVRELADYLTAEHRGKLDDLSGARLRKAQGHYEAGMAAYDAKNYLKAQAELGEAAGLEADLGRSQNRRLTRALADVSDTIERLGGLYREAMAACDAEDFARMAGLLEQIRRTNIAFRESGLAEAEAKMVQGRKGLAERLSAKAGALEKQAAKLRDLQNAIRGKWLEVSTAWEGEEYTAAKSHLEEISKLLAQEDMADLEALDGIRASAGAFLGVVDRQIEIIGKLAGAQKLLGSDLTQAEKLVYEARTLSEQDTKLAFTPSQERMFQKVVEASEARYGPERALIRAQYRRLRQLAVRYRNLGQVAKAKDFIQLVLDAGPGMVREEEVALARKELNGIDIDRALQGVEADKLQATFEGAGERLEAGDVAESIDIARLALAGALEKGLAAGAVEEIGKKTAAFLEQEVATAMTSSRADLAAAVGGKLPVAQALIKERLAAAAAMAEPSAEQAQEVYDLAQKFDAHVRAGRLKEATDAQVRLAVAKARLEAQRGQYETAAQLLNAAPVADASEDVVSDCYKPLAGTMAAFAAVAEQLKAVETALVAHDLEKAVAALSEAGRAGVEADFLQIRMEVLVALVEPVRQAVADEKALKARLDGALRTAKAALKHIEDRQQAWQAYFDAVKSFLQDIEEGRKALTKAAGSPNLLDFEKKNITTAIGEAVEPIVGDAQEALDLAQMACRAGYYIRADQLLDEASKMSGLTLSAKARRRLAALRKTVEQKEAEAQKLLDEAREMMKRGDRQRVADLLDRLKMDYKHTRVYAGNM